MGTPTKTRRLALALMVAASAVMLAACGGGAQSSSTAKPQAQGKPMSASEAASRVNIDEIFPAGPGRDLVLNNCTICHTFVPIVVLQMTPEAWERNSRDHRERVAGLSEDEIKTLYEYLVANFNPDRPVPKLPKALLDTWTSY
jgi:cytochrome c5